MHSEALAALYQEYDTAAAAIDEKTKQLESYRDDYKALRNRLKTLPDRIEYDALVPLGPKALGYGKIVHTNEVMCMLGDNWFMECSAKSACEIVDRRIKKCNQHIEEQKQENTRLDNWRSSIAKLILETSEKDTLQIVEEVKDEEYEGMRIAHRESVKRHKSNLAMETAHKSQAELDEENRKFWERLEELELEEELLQEEEIYKIKSIKKPAPRTVSASTSKGIMKKSGSRDSMILGEKSDKQVAFADEPDIKEIPRMNRYDAENYGSWIEGTSDEALAELVPSLPVGGVKDNVVERIINLSMSDPQPSTSAAAAAKTNPVENLSENTAPPKKVSLFKQRRGT